MKRTISILLVLLFASTCISAPFGSAPRRIIVLIGDGMGPVHVETMRIVAEPFHLARIPHRGNVATRSADNGVTDSAAAATAIATGFKTNNRMVSVDPNGRRLPTVLEQAASQGLATGVVTTTSFFDATPAAFTAHARSRAEGTAIVREMLDGPTNVIIDMMIWPSI